MAVLSQPIAVASGGRALWLDVARGVAILAMIAYHFSFDLYIFGMVDWQVATAPHWRAFAASIASTFVFCAGVSLVYGHGAGIRWRAFGRRLAILVLAAAAVSAVSAAAMPAPIYFGILHAIALFSVLALPFLRLPLVVVLGAALAVFILPHVWRSALFSEWWGYPFGLAPQPPITLDYEPIFPWFGVILLGVAFGRVIEPKTSGLALPAAYSIGARLGRNSLVIYLVHQPVLFAILTGVVRLT